MGCARDLNFTFEIFRDGDALGVKYAFEVIYTLGYVEFYSLS